MSTTLDKEYLVSPLGCLRFKTNYLGFFRNAKIIVRIHAPKIDHPFPSKQGKLQFTCRLIQMRHGFSMKNVMRDTI